MPSPRHADIEEASFILLLRIRVRQVAILATHDPDIVEFEAFRSVQRHDLHGGLLAIRTGSS